ncbi:MAG: amidohydrolase family protein [Candidatus Binatia bacterium]
MPKRRLLIKNGHVLTMDGALGDLPGGDVLIEGDRIADVARDIPLTDCEIVDAAGGIVLPGFVDTHRHTWQTQLRGIAADWTLLDYVACMRLCYSAGYEAEDARLGNNAGALEALASGITSLVDHSHIVNTPEHADAALDGLEQSGIRAVYCYGMFGNPVREPGKPMAAPGFDTPPWHFDDARRLRTTRLSSDEGLVRMGIAMNEVEAFPTDVAAAEIRFARELGIGRLSCHVAMGAHSRDARLVERLGEAGLLGPDLLFVHGAALTDRELELIAEAGASISVTPETEVQMGMGHPVTGRVLGAGACVSLGIDIVSNYSGDMFSQMRLGLQIERFRRNAELESRGLAPRRLQFTVRDILRIATLEGARAAGLEDRVGSLRSGKQADVILIRTDALNMAPVNDPVASVVLCANASNVDSVFVAGRAIKRDGRMLDVDLPRLVSRLEASRDRILASAGVTDLDGLREMVAPFFPLG